MCIIKLSESIFFSYKIAEISNLWIHLYISDNCLNDVINDCLQLDISSTIPPRWNWPAYNATSMVLGGCFSPAHSTHQYS